MFFGMFILLFVTLLAISVNAFGPRAFLKREDQSVSESASAAKPESLAGNAQADEKMTAAETKRFEPENFYGAGLQAKRFEQTDGYYEQPWVAGPYPQQKRFDYFLDGYYGGGPAVAPMARYNNFMPFYAAPAKRFDFGYGPRSRLSGFL